MTNHLWQSTVFAAAAALLMFAFRENRAHVRFWLWFAASVKFLVPFAVLLSLSSWLSLSPKKQVAPIAVSRAVVQMSEPFNETAPVVQRVEPRRNWTPAVFGGVWAIGFLAILAMRLGSWRRIRALVRVSRLVDMGLPIEARFVKGLVEPGIYGFTKPVLLLPDEITTQLSEEKMQAVVAHELCHVRRNDNATSAIHMLVEAVFWFYPVVWWIGARLLEERERACDEEVVREGHRPEAYAEAILDVCRSYRRSQLECVAGISGSDLKGRIRTILGGRVLRELNFAGKLALAGAAVVAIALPIFVGVLRAQTQVPKWEVASIRACEARQPNPGGGGGLKGGRGGGNSLNTSPDRMRLPCLPIGLAIHTAYIEFAGGKYHSEPDLKLEPGPGWIYSESERYQIEAKAEGTPGQLMMRGPMLAALLEERCKLKIHRESRETPLYELVVAKGGIKIEQAPEGGCVVRDRTIFPMAPIEPGEKPCGMGAMIAKKNGAMTLLGNGATMTELANGLSGSGRPVIDKTGVAGRFNFRIKFMPADQTPEADEADAPSVFTALADVGLKLEPIKGQREFLVIDHIERPTEN